MHTLPSPTSTTGSSRKRTIFPACAARSAFRSFTAVVVAWAAAGCFGCGGPGAEAPPNAAPPSKNHAEAVTEYTLKGVVRSTNVETGEVVIRHEEVPGFMDAMTMPFTPEDRAVVATLHPGDSVEGTLRVVRADGAVTDFQLRDLRAVSPPSKTEAPAVTEKTTVSPKFRVREPPPRLKPGELVPDFEMVRQDGETARLSDLRGKVVVLTFIYTRCPVPDFCPRMDRAFSRLAQSLSAVPKRAENVRLVSLSFDPEHDTPEVLAKHARIRGAMPPLWSYAVASHEELAKIAPRLGLFFGPDGQEIAHNLCTAVIGPDGRLARVEVGTQPNRWETADMVRTVRALLPGASG